MSEPAEFGLLVSFHDQSSSYVHGFEAGQLWERMRSGTEAEIETMVHTENRITLDRMAVAEGWDAEFVVSEIEEWSMLTLRKRGKPIDRPNPNGLRVVKP